MDDDGDGVNLDAVRRRAVERGMIGKDDEPDKRQLIEFILDSGFSTSTKVTGLAGRGVGMDVVNSEIKQIGGSMEIASKTGKGTRCVSAIATPSRSLCKRHQGVLARGNAVVNAETGRKFPKR